MELGLDNVTVNGIYILDCGAARRDTIRYLGKRAGIGSLSNPNPERKMMDVPYLAYIIDTSEGGILVDSGVNDDIQNNVGGQAERMDLIRYGKEYTVENNLKRAGFEPEDIRLVIQTHLHWDHSGGLQLFSEIGTPVLVQRSELEEALSSIWLNKEGENGPYHEVDIPKKTNWIAVEARSIQLSSNIRVELVGGHTRGSQIVIAGTKSGGRYALVGDLYHIYEEYRSNTTGLVTTDVRTWESSIARLRLMGILDRKTVLMGAHDPELLDRFPMAPKIIG